MQPDLVETQAARSLLDELLSDSKLYTQRKEYKELLDFVVRLRNFAPFNAMLLQIQKPGLSYAASGYDWQERFGRRPKPGARPLLILWPFGPVVTVYDVQDTEGPALPDDVMATFIAKGAIDAGRVSSFLRLLGKKHIDWVTVDTGDLSAGSIRLQKRASSDKEAHVYQLRINRNHEPATQFTTIAHELAHLFLGHLGPDRKLNVPERPSMGKTQQEIEAESVAFLVAARNGVKSKSDRYLSDYVTQHTTVEHIDIYQVMRAAGQVESLLGLSAHSTYKKPRARGL